MTASLGTHPHRWIFAVIGTDVEPTFPFARMRATAEFANKEQVILRLSSVDARDGNSGGPVIAGYRDLVTRHDAFGL